ncbi:MAG: DUF2267 domain-containing protein [Hyphomicrobiales bacterium]|nr:DUF2267 domain-containing protein [Hyphomicrobiales bacterium]MBV8288539.1 DUF2267 domain-containing protein [Hyphomicrobiales bacterium]
MTCPDVWKNSQPDLEIRLTPEQAVHLGAQLPLLIRGFYYDGWRLDKTPADERQPAEFVALVAAQLPPTSDARL